MKQIASAYTYNKTSGVIILSGLTIDRDQLLLVVNTTRNVTYYNFADSATTLQSYVNPSVYKGFYDGGGMYNIGDIVQTDGDPYGTAGGFFIRLQAPNAGYAPAVGGGTNSHWAPTSASGATITLNASVVSSASSHNNADALTIYYDDQVSSGVVNVFGKDQNSTATPQIPVISYDEGIGTAQNGYVVPVQISNVGGHISEANPLPVKFGDFWEEPLNLKPNIENSLGGSNGVGLLSVGGQGYTDPLNIPPIHVVSKETNELPYIKANINITKTGVGAILLTNIFMRRVGQYKYQSVSGWAGGEDEVYVEIELKADGGNQWLWQASSLGGFAQFVGQIAYAYPQNFPQSGGFNPADALPPTVYWVASTGCTGTMTVSYEQPSIQPITALDLGAKADAVATTDTGTFSVIALIKRGLQNWTSLLSKIPTLVSGRIPVDGSGVTQPVSGTATPSLPSGNIYSGDPYPAGTKIIPVGGWTDEQDGAHWQALTLTESGHLYTYTLLAPSTNLVGSVSPAQGTTVTNTNFTSITPSTSLVSAVAGRRVLSVFNEGTGVLYISGGGTCTTTSYQVRLGVGEYWEAPAGQLSLAHSAVFATAGTARVTQVT